MIKKMMLLAGMALALVAVAAPVASASWLHEGAPIAQDETVEFTGPANFATAQAGAEATYHMDATLEAGTTTAKVTQFVATNCKGTGALAGTTCTTTAKGLPWAAHISPSGTIEITDINFHYIYYAGPHTGTPVATSSVVGDIKAIPNNAESISSVTLKNVNALTNGNPATLGGTLGVTPAGTYGLEG